MSNLKYISLILAIIMLTSFTPEKPRKRGEGSGIKWISIEEAIELSKKNPKKFFFDIYTDWCGWCKRMDKATFDNQKVGEYMNENFYCIKFNAEKHTEDITLGGKTFSKKGRNHQLAVELLQGKMSYPTVVYLDEKFNMISPVPGYRSPSDFLHMSKYFGDDIYKQKTWEQYNGE